MDRCPSAAVAVAVAVAVPMITGDHPASGLALPARRASLGRALPGDRPLGGVLLAVAVTLLLVDEVAKRL